MKLSLLALTTVVAGVGICDLCGTSGDSASADARAGTAPTAAVAPRTAAAVDTVVLHVEGMDCGGCTLAVRRVLERVEGVTKADVSYERKRAVVTYDPAKATVAQMIAAVATLKYTATVARS